MHVQTSQSAGVKVWIQDYINNGQDKLTTISLICTSRSQDTNRKKKLVKVDNFSYKQHYSIHKQLICM